MNEKDLLNKNKALVNTRQLWEPFQELMKERLETLRVRLEKAPEEVAVYRLQGEIANVRWLLGLRERVNG